MEESTKPAQGTQLKYIIRTYQNGPFGGQAHPNHHKMQHPSPPFEALALSRPRPLERPLPGLRSTSSAGRRPGRTKPRHGEGGPRGRASGEATLLVVAHVNQEVI